MKQKLIEPILCIKVLANVNVAVRASTFNWKSYSGIKMSFFKVSVNLMFLIISDVHSKCFQSKTDWQETSTNLSFNGVRNFCNLCAMSPASTVLTTPASSSFQVRAMDVLQLRMKCAWTCASSLDCVGFNFRADGTLFNIQAHCQMFTYTPLLFISNDSCIYHEAPSLPSTAPEVYFYICTVRSGYVENLMWLNTIVETQISLKGFMQFCISLKVHRESTVAKYHGGSSCAAKRESDHSILILYNLFNFVSNAVCGWPPRWKIKRHTRNLNSQNVIEVE
ncbi:hypothetical protein HELRODRAFT_171312 [Helobdella robusta]|uniref:Uncharacterized protein n=1 Tax=Helobdella robusta TaxID=6412 RepID=T1F432_HELRO|nr:hypothetical protein HELRODRAFT_171312 [Helobdella robusta]ESO05654.1 hypothetical protein HELRODRAFT_171312 [Helobdella robusta]